MSYAALVAITDTINLVPCEFSSHCKSPEDRVPVDLQMSCGDLTIMGWYQDSGPINSHQATRPVLPQKTYRP